MGTLSTCIGILVYDNSNWKYAKEGGRHYVNFFIIFFVNKTAHNNNVKKKRKVFSPIQYMSHLGGSIQFTMKGPISITGEVDVGHGCSPRRHLSWLSTNDKEENASAIFVRCHLMLVSDNFLIALSLLGTLCSEGFSQDWSSTESYKIFPVDISSLIT